MRRSRVRLLPPAPLFVAGLPLESRHARLLELPPTDGPARCWRRSARCVRWKYRRARRATCSGSTSRKACGSRRKSVLEVFQFIGRAGRATNTLAAQFNCPVCSVALALTHDLQRTTRFTYWRCRNDHGQLITFHHFLREKNFIRSPSPAELAKLRATVRQVACSQCGAPVDLANATACTHCGAPVALIDPDGVAKALARPRRRCVVPGALRSRRRCAIG